MCVIQLSLFQAIGVGLLVFNRKKEGRHRGELTLPIKRVVGK